jgi:outer membrane receptor protein involved in Fe transport
MQTTKTNQTSRYTRTLISAALFFAAAPSWAQTAAAPSAVTPATEEKEEILELSPFEVTAEDNDTYTAATTLAGNRLNTELRDIGNSVTVITSQFLKDIQATNNETLLQYTAGTEVGNVRGNFAGLGDGAVLSETTTFQRPNQNTRVRGLAAADNTRDYFLSEIPWDSYNVDRVDLQRGPNSILFGLGSPAGLLNVGTKQAAFKDSNEIQYRLDNWGSNRVQGSFNKVIIPKELAVRIDTLYDNEKFQQEPAFEDDRRVYGALRWEPAFLKKGGARTILKASIENGNIASNRPRSVPPLDRITPWFNTGTYNGIFKASGTIRNSSGVATPVALNSTRVFNSLNRETFNPFQVQDDNTGRANHGQQRPVINGGPDAGFFNPGFNPWVGNFAQQFAGTNSFYASGDASTPASNFVWEGSRARGINSLGVIDGDLGRAFHRPVGIARYDQFAANAGLPYYQFGLYKGASLTDDSVFNFYDNLLDGPNKWEWNDWTAYNVSLAQTFMDDKFGFEVNLQNEDFTRGQVSLLTGDRQAIYIDINSVYTDGTPAGKNGEPFQDGTVNPNVGRAFISDSGQGGNNEYISTRDSIRATAFFTHDFNRNGTKGLLTRILGKHTITGLYSDDTQETDNRNWIRYGIKDNNYLNFLGNSNFRFNANELAINRVIYLGGSLSGASSASGVNLPTPSVAASVPSSLTIRAFDSSWTGIGIDPAAVWINEYYPVGHASRTSTQSENPLNYRGFVNTTVNVLDSETDKATRNLLTTGAQLSKSQVTSKAFVWQGYFWDKSIIGTFGYRKDTAKAWGRTLDANNTPVPGYLNLSESNYSLPVLPSNTVTALSRSYSIVSHLNQLPFLSKFAENLPVEVTFFYNKSSNFQPAANRVDIYGIALPAPSGKTIDRGILIETKDGKYSVKINKFVTALKDAGSSGFTNGYYIGASQAWAGNWANRFQYDLADPSNNNMVIAFQANNRPAGSANPPGLSDTFRPGNPNFDATNSLYNYGADVGESAVQAAAREAAAVAGWRAWQASVDPRFYAAWGINLSNPAQLITATQPQGFTITEDSTSEGYEIEFNANPTRNWRLTFNATKVDAVRSNVGGTNLRAHIAAYETALRTTKAGDLRIWWGGAGNDTTFRQWFQNADSQVGSDWAQKALGEGTRAAELRQWRFNAITNYNFSEGRFKGFGIGGGVRWQDKVAIGNRPVGDPLGSTIAFDLSNPYYGGSEVNYDAWVSYNRRLGRKLFGESIDWSIQLNATNLGAGNELIAVTAQPDGSPATYRISPHQYFTLTNTFKF